MASATGIELGPDSCILVSARQRPDGVEVSAMQVLDAMTWPSHDVAITGLLRKARRKQRLPRRAAVVVWGLPEGAAGDEVSSRGSVRPIASAGFRVEEILTPPQALAALASIRPRPAPGAAVAWLALNTWGVAIAIIRNGELLFSRTFDWLYRSNLTQSRDQLLQRYTLVSHLAPELQRGIMAVRHQYGAVVETAVTCGDLPELRSLTMPLIEELDLEVETLDSAEGLRASGRVDRERLTEVAPAIRLAAAAAVTMSAPARPLMVPLRAAAALLLAAAGWLLYSGAVLERQPSRPETTIAGEAAPAVGAPRTTADSPSATGTQGSSVPPEAASGPPGGPSPPTRGTPAPEPTSNPQPDAIKEVPALPPPVRPPAAPASRTATPAPLPDPLPRIDSILIDHNRHLAIIDGRIVGVGDFVGERVVDRIEADAVILREPSGLRVRVALKARVPGRGTGASRQP